MTETSLRDQAEGGRERPPVPSSPRSSSRCLGWAGVDVPGAVTATLAPVLALVVGYLAPDRPQQEAPVSAPVAQWPVTVDD